MIRNRGAAAVAGNPDGAACGGHGIEHPKDVGQRTFVERQKRLGETLVIRGQKSIEIGHGNYSRNKEHIYLKSMKKAFAVNDWHPHGPLIDAFE